MINYRKNIPEGTRDCLFETCRVRRFAEDRLTGSFFQRGYQEVDTPCLEFYDVFDRISGLPSEVMYKLVDHQGRLLVLRPDATLPVVRLAATRLKNSPLPIRLCYNQKIYRRLPSLTGKSHEIGHAGIELLGDDSLGADLEVITAAIEALGCVMPDFILELGHAAFFNALAGTLDLTEDRREEMRRLVEIKNYAGLSAFIEPFHTASVYGALNRLPKLFGGREILEEARQLVDVPEALAALDRLSEVYASLCALGYEDKISLDLGLVHGMGYYTGVVFRGYTAGFGGIILSGGRYGGIPAEFGMPVEAIGFTVDVDAVAGVILSKGDGKKSAKKEYHICGKPGEEVEVLRRQRELIAQGNICTVDLSNSE